jgi:diguanylate cyclase (GGDEF)-like protein
MQRPSKPDGESARLAALRGLGILDTSPEERFDRITRIAKRLFDVPIALVSLVDENRQWFKSRQGLAATETPRDISFCGHAILSAEPLVVSDALLDDRFCDNPLVTGETSIRFYAGCPLTLPNGARVGTLCIIDCVPRELPDEDLRSLRDLAAMVERELVAVQLATMDDLTKVRNRRGFEYLAEHVLKMSRRMEESAFLYYLDLDWFKAINDNFGHAEGDLSLQEFAQALTETFRDSDVLGRIGGDEFAVLVTNTSFEGSDSALQRLSQMLARRDLRASRKYNIHYSVGVVAFDPERHANISELMAEADQAMYEQKAQRKSAANGH